MTAACANGNFGFTSLKEVALTTDGKPLQNADPRFDTSRRDFLAQFSQAAGAFLIPTNLWGNRFSSLRSFTPNEEPISRDLFHLRPHYRSGRPLDATLRRVTAGSDEFMSEKDAGQVAAIFAKWTEGLLQSPPQSRAAQQVLTADFFGASPQPVESQMVRSDEFLQVRRNKFADKERLSGNAFLREWQARLGGYSKIVIAEFQITKIDAAPGPQAAASIHTHVRYEIVGTGAGFYREQRVGNWEMTWQRSASGDFGLRNWRTLDETQARSMSPVYVDITSAALGDNPSYSAQLVHGTDYWRTVLDGASGIDIYGHNGVSVADIDNDGFDDLYICQPAGLPNRLYRNCGDGTFEDVTESSGLGVLDNTSCALFADFTNHGHQDAIIVRASGPLLFVNEGGGKFRQKRDAFQFANPPQGTFTGAAASDYDRDGWLDVYFCLYAYYQGTGQYKYPSPYHDAQNGPPNFLMRNNRDGTFRDATEAAGLTQNNVRYSFCCGWGDCDRDAWPDLYVVNDFGRKNLYRNNGNGTFTDIAARAGAEDVGAGMSVCWLDYDNDGAEDLYAGNMWTAAGERIAAQDNFKKDSPKSVRGPYQKHAMGNSLLRNRGGSFDDATNSSGVAMGRWAWSSEAFDFDHDGFPDLYVANGMVTGPGRVGAANGDGDGDLNSFFWRQVVARSPDDARAAHEYEQGWNAINELIRADGTWSGNERNVFYANNRDGTFSDVSAAVGLEFVEDGRSFALADFDHDGRLEIFLKNRNAPQLRLLKNAVQQLPPSITFRLRGTRSNPDAIGAAITIETAAGRQTRWLQAGSGFLSQHSKDILFGLGEIKGPVQASIQWPSGLVQELDGLPINHRIWVEEGSQPSRLEPFRAPASKSSLPARDVALEVLPTQVETWLLAPIEAPDFSLPDQSGKIEKLSSFRGKPTLLIFWTSKTPEYKQDLVTLQKSFGRWGREGWQIIAVSLDDPEAADTAAFSRQLPFPVLRGSDDVAAIYNILYRQMFDRHRDLSLPTSFLIDRDGDIVKVYQGPTDPEHVEKDFQHIPRTDSERLARALPFPGMNHTLEFGRNYLSYGALFYQRGYLDPAESSFQRALRDDPSSAEALYGVGSVYLNRGKNAAARETFEKVVKMEPKYSDTLPDAWNNLGVIATREGQVRDSIPLFQRALQLNPQHLLSLDNLGNAYRQQKRWDEARNALQRAVEVAPEDPEANYSLGMVFAQTGDNDKAYEFLQRALKSRPDYPEALNNLGILYVVTQHRDQAVASFEECIRVAPDFGQAYLNLARVYAQEGARDKARDLLLEFLKLHPGDTQAEEMLEQLR